MQASEKPVQKGRMVQVTRAGTKRKYIRPDVKRAIEDGRKRGWAWIGLNNKNLSEIPEEVFTFTDLKEIDLSNNKLNSISERLWELPNLRYVNLIGNPIETIPNRSEITIDEAVYCRICKKNDLANVNLHIRVDTPPDNAMALISQLASGSSPKSVIIGKSALRIGEDHQRPSPAINMILNKLSDFKNIESLNLRGIKLNVVPDHIRNLHRLKFLAFSALGLEALPDWIGELDLGSFSALDNMISELPASFYRLSQLKSIGLSFNPLSKIPALIFDLSSLEKIWLRRCGITEVPTDLLRLTKLTHCDFVGNPINSPPIEIVRKGLSAIRDYWRQRTDSGVDYLCEAKLIILGEAGAGKTSLARKIQDPNYKLQLNEKSTEGIDVIRHQFPTSIRTRDSGEEKVLQRDFQVNIWDFGGQEIYHATHQFFLTRRSVYILVCDDRKEDTDFSYWLHVVEQLSDASPILIVQNEKQDRTRDINLSGLRARFSNLRRAIATNLDTNRGLDEVIRAIRRELENLSHVGVGLPATWKRVREALEHDSRDHITLDEYINICQQYGFTRREDKLQLSGYLHDLGICLHFQDDPSLKNVVILKPTWGTAAVYRVLDDHEVINNRGRFTRTQLDRIWHEEKYKGMQDELLRLMMKFQLCYTLESSDTYIAPQLLSSEQPDYRLDLKDGLIVRYEYEFLPKGILTRFIVAMHRLIANGSIVWKTGVVLERDKTRAEIVEDYSQRRIRVRVSGPHPVGLFSIIDEQLERLHATFPRLKYERYLPCTCSECKGKADPDGFALESLVKMAKKGRQIQCHTSGEMVDAGQLVRSILPGALQTGDLVGEPCTFQTPRPFDSPQSPPPEVFVSYAWNTESNAVVDRLQKVFSDQGIHLIRDREELRYKDSIRDFMRRLGQEKCIVVVISEKYLKSENCMFEMVEIANNSSFRERIFPIVLPDANIYKATGRVKYVQHWENEISELDAALKSVRGDNLTTFQENLNLFSEIRRLFDGITDTLRDLNALTPDQHEDSGFDEMIQRMRRQLSVDAS